MKDFDFVRQVEGICFQLENILERIYGEVTLQRFYSLDPTEPAEIHLKGDGFSEGLEIKVSLFPWHALHSELFIQGLVSDIHSAILSDDGEIIPDIANGSIQFLNSKNQISREVHSRLTKAKHLAKKFVENASQQVHSRSLEKSQPEHSSLLDGVKQLLNSIPNSSLNPKIAQEVNEWGLREISPLRLLGYVVGENGLSSNQRKMFLSGFVSAKLPDVFPEDYKDEWGKPDSIQRFDRMINHLSGNINRAATSKTNSFALASKHWKEDLTYLEQLKGLVSDHLDDDLPF